MKIEFEYRFVVFLFAYLRQIDLSLDRSRWTSWTELRYYYKTQIPLEKVINYLYEKSHLHHGKQVKVPKIRKSSFLDIFKYRMLRIFGQNPYLSENEVFYCCRCLMTFDRFLHLQSEPSRLDVENLRVEIVKIAYYVIQYKLSFKDQDRAQSIEHYFQAKNLDVTSMKEFTEDLEFI